MNDMSGTDVSMVAGRFGNYSVHGPPGIYLTPLGFAVVCCLEWSGLRPDLMDLTLLGSAKDSPKGSYRHLSWP